MGDMADQEEAAAIGTATDKELASLIPPISKSGHIKVDALSTVKLEKASQLILDGSIKRLTRPIKDTFEVASRSEPGRMHTVIVYEPSRAPMNSRCTCKAGMRVDPCYHRLAAEYLASNPRGAS